MDMSGGGYGGGGYGGMNRLADLSQNWGSATDIFYIDVTIEVPCSDTMLVVFESDIDQALEEEGWAFSNFAVRPGGACLAFRCCPPVRLPIDILP